MDSANIEPLLRKPTGEISEAEIAALLALPAAQLRGECERMVAQETFRYGGETLAQLRANAASGPSLVYNAMALLVEVGRADTTLAVALGALEQPEAFLAHYGMESPEGGWSPVQGVLSAFGLEVPELLRRFLLGEEPTEKGKAVALEALVASGCLVAQGPRPGHGRDALLAIVRPVLEACVSAPASRHLLSLVVDVAACGGLHELSGAIMPLYDRGLIDEDVCSRSDAAHGLRHGFAELEPPSLRACDWLRK